MEKEASRRTAREVDVHVRGWHLFGCQSDDGGCHRGNRNGVWLARTVRRKPAKERWDRSNLEMVVAVPWRKNEDDSKMDGERLKSEVIVMDKEYKEKVGGRRACPDSEASVHFS